MNIESTLNVETVIYDIISVNTALGDGVRNVGKEDNLLEKGLDSLQMMKVIVEIEKYYGFEFSDEDLLMNNFSQINSILQFVQNTIGK